MSTIFISHSSADNALAEAVAARLKQQGHQSVFLDFDTEKGIVAGRSWERTLYRKLRACEVVVALCTDNYLASQWCFAEIALARMENKHILAIRADPLVENPKIPSIILEKQIVDLRSDPEKAYAWLFRSLKDLDPLGAADWDPGKSPYLGLSAFHEEHAGIFFGREPEIRQGIQLLDRGAPGLIMVLGASGSGKSSLARAGIVPRLRKVPDNWIIVDPFRPGRDPFGELADALARSFRVAQGGETTDATQRKSLRHALRSWRAPPDPGAEAPGVPPPAPDARNDRLERLLDELLALEQQARDNSDTSLTAFLNWSVEDLRRICNRDPAATDTAPGATPLTDLARRLRHLSERPQARVLLVIDQFEELLGADPDEPDSRRLLELLAASLDSDPGVLSVLVTMRSDFLETFQRANARLRIDFDTMSLGPIPVEGIRQVIEGPAKLGAIELETGLADRLIEDSGGADALPLLSFTLWRMWQNEHAIGRLSLDAYRNLGGLNGAVAGEADAILKIARQRNKEADLRAAFQTMVRLTDDGQFARKPVPWDSPALQPVHDILEIFEKQRLVTPREEGGERMVEVAHEALFRTWAPLRKWVDERRADLVLRQQLAHSTRIWDAAERGQDELWRGARLADAMVLLEVGGLDGDDPESQAARDFVKASEVQRLRQARMRRNIIAATTAVLLAFLAYAIVSEDAAKRQQRAAAAQQFTLAANRDLATAPLNSLALAQRAVCLFEAFGAEAPETTHAALNSAVEAAKRQRTLRAHRVGVTDVQFTTNPANGSGAYGLMSLDGNGIAMGWQVGGPMDNQCAAVPPPQIADIPARAMALDPQGRFVALASAGTVRLSGLGADDSADDIGPVMTLPADVTDLRFSPDGRRLAATDLGGRLHIATLSQNGEATGITELGPLGGRLGDLLFTESGESLIVGTWDGRILIRDAGDGTVTRRLAGHAEAVTELAVHDQLLASGGWDASVRIWDGATGALLYEIQHQAFVSGLAIWDKEGSAPLVISASWDGTVTVLDSDTGRILHRLNHGAPVTALAVAPGQTEGGRLHFATGDWDGHVRIWSIAPGLEGTASMRAIARHTEPVSQLSFSPDGDHLASGSDDSDIHFTRVTDTDEALDWHTSLDLEQVETGQTWFAVIVDDGVRVLDAATGTQQRLVTGYEGTARAIAFSNTDGQRLLVDADRRFGFYLDRTELMYCADSLLGLTAQAVQPSGYSLDQRCTTDDFDAYQNLPSRLPSLPSRAWQAVSGRWPELRSLFQDLF